MRLSSHGGLNWRKGALQTSADRHSSMVELGTTSCTFSLPCHTRGWQGIGTSVTPLQQHLGQHHPQGQKYALLPLCFPS